MAPRAFWKGYLKLSLVTCPVSMQPATSENERVRFHTLNAKTGNRVESRYVDAVSGEPVAEEDEVKGYERGEDDYVLLEDDELESVALESARTIDISMFVPANSIGWIWYDTPHYLTPRDRVPECMRWPVTVTGCCVVPAGDGPHHSGVGKCRVACLALCSLNHWRAPNWHHWQV